MIIFGRVIPPYPGYRVVKGVGDTWKIMDYCMIQLVGGEDDKPEVYADNIYDKWEAEKIALRLNIEWWDELSRIMNELEENRGDPKDIFKDETKFDPNAK